MAKSKRTRKASPAGIGPVAFYDWEIKTRLPVLTKPSTRAFEKLRPKGKKPQELLVGGSGKGPGPEGKAAIEFLTKSEQAVYTALLKAIVAHAADVRKQVAAYLDAETLDAMLPRGMTDEDVADQIEVSRITITPQSRDGIAYLEIHGECSWDPEHGFMAVLHRDRVVGVFQQWAQWTDAGAGKRPSAKR